MTSAASYFGSLGRLYLGALQRMAVVRAEKLSASLASDVVLTPELQAIVSTDVAAGETLKIEAAAGSGKSTAALSP